MHESAPRYPEARRRRPFGPTRCGAIRTAARTSARLARRGFTLIEMLVAISIIALVIALGFPVLSAMTEGTATSSATSTVSVATNAARILNSRLKQNPKNGEGFPSTSAYRGTAALFTPSGEVRLLIHDQAAASGSDPEANPGQFLWNQVDGDSNPLLGYDDIPNTEAITLPGDAIVIGVNRDGANASYYLPPFAIRFDQNGRLAASPDYIYYDGVFNGGNPNGTYEVGNGRGGSYDPADFANGVANRSSTTGRFEMPFEEIETVVGIVIIAREDFAQFGAGDFAANGNFSGNEAALLERGDAYFFNPNTGLLLR